ncbi:MAG: hypothetical protein LBB89_02325 [Treponema sp.]|jgi:hypothetical protein|nr:hypothetical protein [Treponema sp.]
MTTQTIDVPPEIPAEEVIFSYTPVSADKDLVCAERVWDYNCTHTEELKTKLKRLQGSLGENAFDGLDGVAYQHKVRDEWDD